MQSRLAVYKVRLADSFLSTDRGRYLYSVDAALGTLNWALLPEGAYTGARLAAWISSNFATAAYSETTNSLSVAYDGNRLNLGDDILSKITLKSGVGTIVETGSDDGHFMALTGPVTLRHMRFRLTDLDGNVVRLRGSSLSFVLYLDHV